MRWTPQHPRYVNSEICHARKETALYTKYIYRVIGEDIESEYCAVCKLSEQSSLVGKKGVYICFLTGRPNSKSFTYKVLFTIQYTNMVYHITHLKE